MLFFLDFDGVTPPVFSKRDLPDDENQLFSYLPRIEAVLRDFPDFKIVIASSWRENRPWKNIMDVFSPHKNIDSAWLWAGCSNCPAYPLHKQNWANKSLPI